MPHPPHGWCCNNRTEKPAPDSKGHCSSPRKRCPHIRPCGVVPVQGGSEVTPQHNTWWQRVRMVKSGACSVASAPAERPLVAAGKSPGHGGTRSSAVAGSSAVATALPADDEALAAAPAPLKAAGAAPAEAAAAAGGERWPSARRCTARHAAGQPGGSASTRRQRVSQAASGTRQPGGSASTQRQSCLLYTSPSPRD